MTIKKTELDKIILDSFEATKDALNLAIKFATEHRDVDAIVAISDRWSAVTERAVKIKNLDKAPKPSLGFITAEELLDEESDD